MGLCLYLFAILLISILASIFGLVFIISLSVPVSGSIHVYFCGCISCILFLYSILMYCFSSFSIFASRYACLDIGFSVHMGLNRKSSPPHMSISVHAYLAFYILLNCVCFCIFCLSLRCPYLAACYCSKCLFIFISICFCVSVFVSMFLNQKRRKQETWNRI